MRHILYGIQYMLRHHVLGKPGPLICGLTLTNRCNLRCQHCRIPTRGARDLSWREATQVIDSYREQGGRCLYLQGGEPLLWRDGERGMEDIVEYAREVGYLTVVVYTNGTLPLETSADTLFVSVDGLKETHDALRGKSFAKIIANIQDSLHPSLYINFTINSRNKDEVEGFCAYIEGLKQIKGTFFYLHTPYYGQDELCLEPAEKERILKDLMRYGKRYRLLNSRAGLRSALKNDWKRPLDICTVYEKGKTYECCRFSGDPELCEKCGYLSYAEIDRALRLHPSAILNALKYF
ncbi:radical SAM protein [Candidatus Eisenbacteria bacterium]|uniref:Radical SAM protein n=1 Tax=Eiseniibacteriota bacterium TaxID=2212470 RepID=A0ABV6YJ59_UNCEI